MIGPKQFDIRHKVKPRREFDNPIVNKIFAPMFKYREDDLDDLVGSFEGDLKDVMESFLDKFKSPIFELKEEDTGPENKSESTKRKSKISDEIINQITYKVFQNIKQYLDKDGKGSVSKGKGIKIEIDL